MNRFVFPLGGGRHVEIHYEHDRLDDADIQVVEATILHIANVVRINESRPELPLDYEI